MGKNKYSDSEERMHAEFNKTQAIGLDETQLIEMDLAYELENNSLTRKMYGINSDLEGYVVRVRLHNLNTVLSDSLSGDFQELSAHFINHCLKYLEGSEVNIKEGKNGRGENLIIKSLEGVTYLERTKEAVEMFAPKLEKGDKNKLKTMLYTFLADCIQGYKV